MIVTIKTLPHYFPEIFVNRIIISVITFAVFCVVTIVFYKRKKFNKWQRNAAFLLSLYIVVLMYFTFIGRYSHEEYEYKVYIFFSYRRLLEHFDYQNIKQIMVNLLMLVPVGFLLPMIFGEKHRILPAFIMSLMLTVFIESMQLVMKCGTFEIDDIINNMIGAVAGTLFYCIINTIYYKHHMEKE